MYVDSLETKKKKRKKKYIYFPECRQDYLSRAPPTVGEERANKALASLKPPRWPEKASSERFKLYLTKPWNRHLMYPIMHLFFFCPFPIVVGKWWQGVDVTSSPPFLLEGMRCWAPSPPLAILRFSPSYLDSTAAVQTQYTGGVTHFFSICILHIIYPEEMKLYTKLEDVKHQWFADIGYNYCKRPVICIVQKNSRSCIR